VVRQRLRRMMMNEATLVASHDDDWGDGGRFAECLVRRLRLRRMIMNGAPALAAQNDE
jgi:hypothetical protein